MSQPVVAILVRVSTDIQTEGTSPEDQEARCRERAAQLGYSVDRVVYEPGVSGRRYQSRQELMTIIHDIEAGRVNALLAYKIDRIGRSADVILKVATRIENAGGLVLTCEGIEFGQSAMGRMMLTLLAMLAEFERNLIIERTHGQRLVRARQGRQMGRGHTRYGYTVVTKAIAKDTGAEPGTYLVHPEQSEVVSQLFEMYAHGGSCTTLINWLKRQAIPSPRGNAEWSIRTIIDLLRDEIYCGKAYYNKTERKRVEHSNGDYGSQKLARPEAEWIPVEAPQIVSPGLYERVQTRLDTARKERSGNRRHDYLLSGMVRCALCGHRCCGHGHTQGGILYRYYSCTQPLCGKTCYRVRADVLEAGVLAAVKDMALHPELLDIEIEAMKARRLSAQPVVDRKALEADLRHVEAQSDTAARAQVAALVAGRDTTVYDRLLTEYSAKRTELLVTLSQTPVLEQNSYDATLLHECIDAFEEVFSSGGGTTISERRELLSTVIESVTAPKADPGNPTIIWRV